MSVRITVVVDNCVPINAGLPFLGEHGLSMLIETQGKKLLLDTGQSSTVVHNLGLLDVAPSSLDMIAVSHGHYDHTGGLYHLFARAGKAIPVYVHEEAFKPRFSTSHGQRQFVGIPYAKEQLSSLGADWKMTRHPLELLPGVWLSGSVPRSTSYETGDARLVVRDERGGCDCQDDIVDDMALFFKSSKGLVVVSGCTHSGLVNMVRHGLHLTGSDRLHGWVGGTHLGPVTREQQDRSIEQLLAFEPEFVAANHCTGFLMMARLQQAFSDRFIPAFVGTTLEF